MRSGPGSSTLGRVSTETPATADPDERQDDLASVRARISNALAALHKRHYGKGPERVRTHITGETVLVLLYGGLTAIERTLREAGRIESVLEQRREFQLALEGEFKQIVTEATGQEVVAFMSVNHLDPDVCAEIFLLAEPWAELSSGSD